MATVERKVVIGAKRDDLVEALKEFEVLHSDIIAYHVSESKSDLLRLRRIENLIRDKDFMQQYKSITGKINASIDKFEVKRVYDEVAVELIRLERAYIIRELARFYDLAVADDDVIRKAYDESFSDINRPSSYSYKYSNKRTYDEPRGEGKHARKESPPFGSRSSSSYSHTYNSEPRDGDKRARDEPPPSTPFASRPSSSYSHTYNSEPRDGDKRARTESPPSTSFNYTASKTFQPGVKKPQETLGDVEKTIVDYMAAGLKPIKHSTYQYYDKPKGDNYLVKRNGENWRLVGTKVLEAIKRTYS
jgi:hypothetical protein